MKKHTHFLFMNLSLLLQVYFTVPCDLSQVNVRTRLESYHRSFCSCLYRVRTLQSPLSSLRNPLNWPFSTSIDDLVGMNVPRGCRDGSTQRPRRDTPLRHQLQLIHRTEQHRKGKLSGFRGELGGG